MLQNPLVGDETFEIGELDGGATRMKTINGRIRKLEDQVGIGNGRQRILLILCHAGWGLPLDLDRHIQILDESDFLPTGPVGLVNLCQLPAGLNGKGLERYLRENGAEICGLRGAQNHGGLRSAAQVEVQSGLRCSPGT